LSPETAAASGYDCEVFQAQTRDDSIPSGDGVELRSVSLETGEETSHVTLRPLWVVAPFVDVSPRDEVVWVEQAEGARELWLMDLAAR
jgi:hypothetical protein